VLWSCSFFFIIVCWFLCFCFGFLNVHCSQLWYCSLFVSLFFVLFSCGRCACLFIVLFCFLFLFYVLDLALCS
jgi:hypothetical protein